MSLKNLVLSTAAAAVLFAGGWALACDKCSKISSDAPAVLFEDVTALHRPITTKSAEAQQYFDHDEAIRSFKKAAELDPDCAMAWWGVALALGPNYNIDVTPETELAAFQAIQKAIKLKGKVSQPERDYIDTLATRFTDAKDPDLKKLARDYATAAGKLSQKYPDDTDAATLHAESMMLLRRRVLQVAPEGWRVRHDVLQPQRPLRRGRARLAGPAGGRAEVRQETARRDAAAGEGHAGAGAVRYRRGSAARDARRARSDPVRAGTAGESTDRPCPVALQPGDDDGRQGRP
jgi:hypothetical protein